MPLVFATHVSFCFERPAPDTSANIAENYRNQAKAEYSLGHYEVARRLFEQAINAAQKLTTAGRLNAFAATETQARSLVGMSGCKIALFEYRTALQYSEQGKRLAIQIKKEDIAGAAAANLSTVYYQLGDLRLAEREANDAVQFLESADRDPKNDSRRLSPILLSALLAQANTRWDNKDFSGARASYNRGIDKAREAGSILEADIREDYGTSLLLLGDDSKQPDWRGQARLQLDLARKIEKDHGDRGRLAINDEHQAELELKQQPPDYRKARRFIDAALNSPSFLFKKVPHYYPLHIRAKVLLGLGLQSEALGEFRRAVDAADLWRQGALPGDITSTRTVIQLHQVYQDYVELAAGIAIKNSDALLSAKAFEVLAGNRAASLREQLAHALGRDFRLPPRYFELQVSYSSKLAELQKLQASVTLGQNAAARSQLDRTRTELADVQNQMGILLGGPAQRGEKNSNRNSLRDIQSRLAVREVLLSFSLGDQESFLWAITRDHVGISPLSPASEIAQQIARLNHLEHGQFSQTAVESLSKALFGKLGASVWGKSEWLITADGVLLDKVPFSLLRVDSAGETSDLLIRTHSLRILPSEYLLLAPASKFPDSYFLGICDPIYNLADSRVDDGAMRRGKPGRSGITLARLVGSGREARDASQQSGLKEREILSGKTASLAMLQKATSKTPEVLHFAVHVVSPDGRPQEAALALSLTQDKIPELLTPEAVAALRVPGSLVILSGCSSGQGDTAPSAGLMGLSRAWLLAGASAVVVSAWPTPDDSGQFFHVFYRHLQAPSPGSLALKAATALQQTQLEMAGGGGYRSLPSFWAAYSIFSKE